MVCTVLDSEFSLPEYMLFRRDRHITDFPNGMYTNAARGGVCILMKNTINCTLSSINDHNTESLWLNISSSIGSLLLGVCYRPELAGNTYVENLCKCFNDLPHTTDALIVGDFNFRDICWESNISNSFIGNFFLNCVNNNYLHQLIDTPTRVNYINDLLLTNNMTIVENFTIEHNFSTSDHKLMSVNINFFQPPVVKQKRKVYLYSKGDYVSIQEKVNNMDWNTLLSSNIIEDNWSTFKMIYNNLVDKHIPFKCLVPGKHYKVPWLNDHIVKRAKAKRRKAKVNLNKNKK